MTIFVRLDADPRQLPAVVIEKEGELMSLTNRQAQHLAERMAAAAIEKARAGQQPGDHCPRCHGEDLAPIDCRPGERYRACNRCDFIWNAAAPTAEETNTRTEGSTEP